MHCVAGCAPPQLRKEQTWARVQFSLEHLLQLKLRDLFSVVDGDQTFEASQASLCLLGWPAGVQRAVGSAVEIG